MTVNYYQHTLVLSRRGGGRAGCGTIRSSWRGSKSICRAVSCPAAQADQGKAHEKIGIVSPEFLLDTGSNHPWG